MRRTIQVKFIKVVWNTIRRIKMDKKMLGTIVMAVAGVTSVVMLILIWKWAPIPVVVLAVSIGAGYYGNSLYRKG